VPQIVAGSCGRVAKLAARLRQRKCRHALEKVGAANVLSLLLQSAPEVAKAVTKLSP